MKNLITIVAASFTLMSFSFILNVALSDIVNAFKQNNVSEISKYFDDYVDMKLPGKEEAKGISKNQATQTLKDFYSEQGVSGFELTSQRELGGTGYLTGKLKSDGHTYNITIMAKTKGSESNVVSIRIN